MSKIGAAVAEYFRQTDKWLLLLWLGASGLSILFLSGIKYSELLSSDSTVVRTQLIACIIGLVAALVISLIDYRLLLKLWKIYVPICVILVGLTFISGLGTVRGDNQAWIVFQLAGRQISIQPAELLKISFITTFSMHLAKVRENLNSPMNVLLLCLHGGAHVLLIQMQNDTGTALIFLSIFSVMIFCAGLAWRYIIAAVVAVAAAAPLFWMKILSEDQKMRILILFNPELDLDRAWQQNEALRAFVHGGMQGTGVFRGQHVYVAEAYNDFIFSFIGEACGFIGCLGVIILLCTIAFKILHDSYRARDDEGRFICIGVFAMIIAQMVVNLGMCIGLLPVIGVTLPLFSSGGSSVLSMYVSLGFVLSVYRQSQTKMFFD